MSTEDGFDPADAIRQVQLRGKLDGIKLIEAKLADPDIREHDQIMWTAALKWLQDDVAGVEHPPINTGP